MKVIVFSFYPPDFRSLFKNCGINVFNKINGTYNIKRRISMERNRDNVMKTKLVESLDL